MLKSEFPLPKEVDSLIFQTLHGKYKPSPKQVTDTLNWGNEQLKVYLGTYWPRSFSEIGLICDELEVNPAFLSCQDKFNILALGSGTGGDLAGLIWFLMKRYHYRNLRFDVVSIDGNPEAINLQQKIIDALFGHSVTLRIVQHVFNDGLTIENELKELLYRLNLKFDYMLSSKFINEFYTRNNKCKNLYSHLINACSQYLADYGLLFLIEVNLIINGKYLSQIINSELVSHFQSRSSLVPVFPLSCALWHGKCSCADSCFNQVMLGVQHSHSANDLSQITTRVLANPRYARLIMKFVQPYNEFLVAHSSTEYGDWYSSCSGGTFIRNASRIKDKQDGFSMMWSLIEECWETEILGDMLAYVEKIKTSAGIEDETDE